MSYSTEMIAEPQRVNLWYRRNRSEAWRIIASAGTSGELVRYMAEYRQSGEFMDLAAGRTPSEFVRKLV